MKNLKKVGALLIFAVSAITACTSGSQDSQDNEKIAALEERIKELEASGTTPTATPTSAATNEAAETPPDGPVPSFDFTEEEYDFGTISAGEIVEHTFKFTNTGEAPLIIQSATASCGCTVPTKPTEPIAVGATGEIGVRFDSKNKSGAQSPVITIRANTYPAVTRVRLKGTVNAAAAGTSAAGGPVR